MKSADAGRASLSEEASVRLRLVADVIREMPSAAFITDAGQATGRPSILAANAAAIELTGYSFAEMEGKSPIMFSRETVDEEKLAAALAAFQAGEAHRSRTVQKRPDGALYYVDWSMTPVRNQAGEVDFFLWLQGDVSQRVEAEGMRDTLFEALDLAEDSVIISSDEGIEFVNRGFRRLSGLDEADVLGNEINALEMVPIDPRTLEPTDLVAPDTPRILIRGRSTAGASVYLDIATTVVVDKTTGARRLVHVGKDVTEDIMRRSEERARANRDPLTGLLNRRGGEAMLDAARAEAQARGGTFSVVMGDIDRFKSVNDRYGHPVGDAVLQAVASALEQNVRAESSVVRWGGEEFLVVLPAMALDTAVPLAERLRALVAEAETEPAGAVTISLGVAEWFPGEGLASVVSRADKALYSSKTHGRDRVTRAAPPHSPA
ncbi:diguanylate cyclase [Salinibacterium sp. SYSU T00001]|uniref:GGDEF domain-containing protein n=1 Tax=Homoserinimonas sedimenticola TaxID=2986805 RepID=UPI0022358D6E|nr:diguanylate cyclase [Salinibacterium sedimenticola]MCW4386804.1 diguanylate cyclase [Salinibacterium sedimenticola]